jgi:uncharacterized protein YcbX
MGAMSQGRVVELWRYPVKSMLGEQLTEAPVTERGIPGDRNFALVDTETGKICSAKRHDLWGELFRFRARMASPTTAEITFPDGATRATDDPEISDALSNVLGRSARLDTKAPADARIEEIWPEAKGPNLYGPKIGEHDGEAVIDFPASFGVPGGFFDLSPIHVLTTNSISELGRLEPTSAIDVRRFRPNIVVAVDDEEGFVENDWDVIRIGDVELGVVTAVPRCVMTTLAQDELARDPNVLRGTAKHNMLETPLLGNLPCLGVYASPRTNGTVRVGDAVAVERK